MAAVLIVLFLVLRLQKYLETSKPLPPLSPATYSVFSGVSGEAPNAFRGFAWKLTVTFALFVTAVLVLARWLFPILERLTVLFGTVEWWPSTWPGTPTPDFVALEFLALFCTLAAVVGLEFRAVRLPLLARMRPLGFGAAYLVVATALDGYLSVVQPNEAVSIFVRALLGSSFLGGALLATVAGPDPIAVPPRVRDPRIPKVLFLSVVGGTALAIIVVVEVFYPLWRSIPDPLFAAAVLLLVPSLAYIFFGAIALGCYLVTARREERGYPSLDAFHPSISVVIPAFNEEASIAETLRQIDTAAAEYPGTVEVVVGNDGSRDRTSEVATATLRDLAHIRGRCLDLPHGGKSSALNGALLAATGDVVIRIDADTTVTRFAPIVRFFADPDMGEVQGKIVPARTTDWIGRLRTQEVMWNHAFLRRALMATGGVQVLSGNFCAFRRDRLIEAGGWVPWNGEDAEISLRLTRMGYRCRLDLRSMAYEDTPRTLKGLIRQRIRWVRGGYFSHLYHVGGLLGGASNGTPALAIWIWQMARSSRKFLVYLFGLLLALTFLPLDLAHVLVLGGLLLLPRVFVIGFFLARWGYWRQLPWIAAWYPFSVLKAYFSVEALGTVLPGNTPEFSD